MSSSTSTTPVEVLPPGDGRLSSDELAIREDIRVQDAIDEAIDAKRKSAGQTLDEFLAK